MAAERDSFFAGSGGRVLRHNFFANMMDGALYAFGLSFASQQTVLPVFVQKIGGGNVAIGLIPVLWMLSFNLPQILIASHAQRQRHKKRLLLKTAMGQRLPWLLLAVLAFFILPRVTPLAGLMLFFIIYASAGIGGSINLPVWFDIFAKMTPISLRGRLFAARMILGGVLGIGAGIAVRHILAWLPYPGNFGLIFLLTFAAMLVSYFFLTILKEPRSARSRTAAPLLREYLGALPSIIREERNYRNFLIADGALYLAWMANGFFTVHALSRFDLPASAAGTFTAIMMASNIAGNLFFGWLADHFGQRINLILSAGMMTLSCALAIFAPGPELYCLVFVGSALAIALVQISRLPLIAELCSAEQRPTFVALANLISSPFIIAGVAGGWLADRCGYEFLFACSGLFALFSMGWYASVVREPRGTAHERVF
ncbi:MAG TPA: MFS transporter [bacterium]|nr:MFS transporter [bacterium]